MKLIILLLSAATMVLGQAPDAATILRRIDENLFAENIVMESKMVIHGRRNSRSVVSKGYGEGTRRSFTEYLSPAREKGTKMLKLERRLWIYSPTSDRTIQLSGHMLRQSLMGSDLSYEDMMEDQRLSKSYVPAIVGETVYDERAVWILELKAIGNQTYSRRKVWVDKERFIPLQEELYAKGGQLLKRTQIKEVMQVDGRWYPRHMNYKDVLKDGKGTDFIIDKITFNAKIPAYIFTKAALKK